MEALTRQLGRDEGLSQEREGGSQAQDATHTSPPTIETTGLEALL